MIGIVDGFAWAFSALFWVLLLALLLLALHGWGQ